MDRVERYRLLLKRWGCPRGEETRTNCTVLYTTVQYSTTLGVGRSQSRRQTGPMFCRLSVWSLIFDVSAQALWSEAVLYCLRVSQSNMSSLSNHLRDHP